MSTINTCKHVDKQGHSTLSGQYFEDDGLKLHTVCVVCGASEIVAVPTIFRDWWQGLDLNRTVSKPVDPKT